MEAKELIEALNRLKVETGSLACMGCGYEHSCSIHGCAIIREAVKKLEIVDHCFMAVDDVERLSKERGWISVKERLPEPYETVLISILSKNGYGEDASIENLGCYERGALCSYIPLAEGEKITHWMPLPEPPEGV